MTQVSKIAATGATALMATLLTGCVLAPLPSYNYGYSYENGYSEPAMAADVYAPMAPPAPYVEVIPALPFAGAVWLGGYWNWYGGRHTWVPGHYERPHPGYHWSQRRWEPTPRGNWHLRGGGWRR